MLSLAARCFNIEALTEQLQFLINNEPQFSESFKECLPNLSIREPIALISQKLERVLNNVNYDEEVMNLSMMIRL